MYFAINRIGPESFFLMSVRLDGSYLYSEILNTLVQRELQLIIACRYDWVISQGVVLNESNWQQIDEMIRLYDVGKTTVVSTCEHQFRVVRKTNPLSLSKRLKSL